MTRAFVGLGSNLGDSPGIIRVALAQLRALGAGFVNSDLYVTQPWGGADQPAYINAVAAFDTARQPDALLAELLAIEADLGRVRTQRDEPRTIDLDLLLFGDTLSTAERCIVPHPHLRERAFVLGPLAEIAPEARVPPDGATVRALFAALPDAERATIRRLAGTAVLAPPARVDYDAPDGAGVRYDDLRPFSPFDRMVLAAVLEATGPVHGRALLDVGCGTGRFTEALAEMGARATGCDASETMLSAARARGTNVTYVSADANVALPLGPWDVVTAFYCIQYLEPVAWIGRVRDALAPGGTVAVATFPHRHFALV
jgi:2-amino-4-hydroxy-6-hydroxymethyldihydropteridine diphosphokinase